MGHTHPLTLQLARGHSGWARMAPAPPPHSQIPSPMGAPPTINQYRQTIHHNYTTDMPHNGHSASGGLPREGCRGTGHLTLEYLLHKRLDMPVKVTPINSRPARLSGTSLPVPHFDSFSFDIAKSRAFLSLH